VNKRLTTLLEEYLSDIEEHVLNDSNEFPPWLLEKHEELKQEIYLGELFDESCDE
jgi:hypothetical protein